MKNIAKAIMHAEGILNFYELTILALEEAREEEENDERRTSENCKHEQQVHKKSA